VESDDSLWMSHLLGELKEEDDMNWYEGKPWSKDMSNMHHQFGVHEKIKNMDKKTLRKFLKFRAECIQEEADELHHAISGKNIDAEETVDALIDICVFAIGTLDLFEVDAEKAWKEVYNANRNKEIGIKKERPNPFGLPDLIKPSGWKPPSHKGNHGKLNDI
jgi:predicted HAD superfamily Cof-like phosphohydrolase